MGDQEKGVFNYILCSQMSLYCEIELEYSSKVFSPKDFVLSLQP